MMSNWERFFVGMVVVLLVVLGYMLIKNDEECTASGGTYVLALIGFKCINTK